MISMEHAILFQLDRLQMLDIVFQIPTDFYSPDRTTNAMNQREFCVTQTGDINSGGMYGSNITDSYGQTSL